MTSIVIEDFNAIERNTLRRCTQIAAGKVIWVPIVSFTSKELRDKFSAAALGALRTVHPETFTR